MQPIFVVFHEQKDGDCLAPVVEALQALGFAVNVLRWTAGGGSHSVIANQIIQQSCGNRPFIIIATREVGRLVRLHLNEADPVLIYTEHGIAPFKNYSFHSHYLRYTYTLFPTNLLRYRMNRLYPDYTSQFMIGGYPRLDALHQLVEQRRAFRDILRQSYYPNADAECLKLLILSWNISENAYKNLPDDNRVSYLLHPATPEPIIKSRIWEHANVVLSTPEKAADLFVASDFVIGELSSLTMEAAAFSPNVVWLIDKCLYIAEPDIDPEFFDSSSAHYLRIPMTSIVLNASTIFSLDDLPQLLDARLEDLENYRPGVTALPEIAFARQPGENTPFTTNKIVSLAKRHGITPKPSKLG